MRLLPLIIIMLAGSLFAGEPTAYPLWDGSESVAEYAKKVNLPANKTLDLGNNVTLELVLIPAGKFVMGTPEPIPVDEDGFHKRILTGQALLVVSGVALLVMLVVVIVRAVRKKRRPQISLALLLLVTVAAGGAVLSGVNWRQSVRGLEQARIEFAAAKTNFDVAEQKEKPAHIVTITKPFYFGKFPVTQVQYQALIGTNPSRFRGKDNPVEQVSWDDAQAFCKTLAKQTNQTAQLPTEAQWEYACRAGTVTTYSSGDTEAELARVAWYDANSKSTTYPVGQKQPNGFGLYDMHGNVRQWCQDWSQDDYYEKSPAVDPKGPVAGNAHIVRGGSWLLLPKWCRSAYRFSEPSSTRYSNFGFRVVSPASTPP